MGGHPGSGALIDIYLYDPATGELMLGGNGTVVCNPCTFGLGAADGAVVRKRTIVLDDLISAAGGFGGQKTKPAFAVISVGGEDPAGVSLEGFVVNSHTSPFDLSVFGFEPNPVGAKQGNGKRAFVLPHVMEKSGTIAQEQYTFDTSLLATYTPGLAGLADGAGASLEFYLYGDNGLPMQGLNGTSICDPCSYNLGKGGSATSSPRKLSIRVDDLITARGGGFDAAVKLGFGIVVVGGADPSGVNLEGFVVNSHTSAFDLSVFGFEPQPILSARALIDTNSPDGGLASKAFVLPHILEKSGAVTEPFSVDDTLFATYAGGLGGIPAGTGATLKLYLYDSRTGQPLLGSTGEVCNPCRFDLTSAKPKLSIRIEDLMVERGGGFGASGEADAFAVAVLDGDAQNVNLQGFVVNSHTSPFDLSVFGFDPQLIAAAKMRPPLGQFQNGLSGFELRIQTVIGGKYTLETITDLAKPAWEAVMEFEGDGTVKTVPVTQSGAQQFIRVKGM